MKNFITIFVLVLLLAGVSCDKNFDNINQNPFDPTETSIGALFNSVIASLRMSNEEQLYINNETLYAITQQAALSRSSFPAYAVGTEVVWKNYYEALAHIRAIEDGITELETSTDPEALNNVKGMLKVITAYKTFRITDLFGDIPFFDAGRAYQGLEFSRPAFDTQDDIYKFLLEELKWAADNMVATGNPTTEGGTPYVSFGNFDTFFGGEIFLWVKFANALRLKHALRMIEKDADFAQPILQEIIANDLPLIRDFEDVVMHPALQGWSRTSSHFGYFNSTGPFNSGLRLGSTIWKELAEGEGMGVGNIIDPRSYIFFEANNSGEWEVYPQISNSETPESGGGPYAIVRDASHSFKGQANIYAPVNYYLIRDEQDVPEILMTAAEVYFCLAEVHQRGLGVMADVGTAGSFYNLGIVSSINFWQNIRSNSDIWENNLRPDLTQGEMFALTNHPKLNISDTADPLQKIYTQRWIDNFCQPWEAYNLLRRTGKTPKEGEYIAHYRFPYPPSEGIDNAENYAAQVTKMGDDSEKIKVWWME